jgi:hypothetical protein
MRSWRRGKPTFVSLRGGRLLWCALCFVSVAATLPSAQTTQHKPVAEKATARRVNELTLAGLRPGRDTKSRAAQLYGKPSSSKDAGDGQVSWQDACNKQFLTIELNSVGEIQELRATVVEHSGIIVDCRPVAPSPWKTGHGLRIGDTTNKMSGLYGQPDSKSPSTRDGQPLELWYYAFDWAGPDVPQVMEVLCTREKDGQPGRVVEITLAAPSL